MSFICVDVEELRRVQHLQNFEFVSMDLAYRGL
jgi:hypothetical protein